MVFYIVPLFSFLLDLYHFLPGHLEGCPTGSWPQSLCVPAPRITYLKNHIKLCIVCALCLSLAPYPLEYSLSTTIYIYIYPDQIQTSTSLLPDFLSCPCPHSVITLCLIHQVSHLTFPLIFSSSVNQFRQLLMICASPTGVAYPFKIFLKCHVYLLLFTTVGVCLRIIFLCSALKVG